MGFLAAMLLLLAVVGATGVLGLLAAGVADRASGLGRWLEGSAVAGRGISGLRKVLFGRTGAEERLPLVEPVSGRLVARPPTAGFDATRVDASLVGDMVGPADEGLVAGKFLIARLRAMASLTDGRGGAAEVFCDTAAALSPSTAATAFVLGNGLVGSLRRSSCCFFSRDKRILKYELVIQHHN